MALSVDPLCVDYKSLRIKNDRVTAINSSSVFFKEKLGMRCSFSVKILSLNKYIAVGIADASLKGEFVFTKNNILTLDNSGTYKLGDDTKKNASVGFSKGDKITICVDFNEKSIEWKNDKKFARKFENVKLL